MMLSGKIETGKKILDLLTDKKSIMVAYDNKSVKLGTLRTIDLDTTYNKLAETFDLTPEETLKAVKEVQHLVDDLKGITKSDKKQSKGVQTYVEDGCMYVGDKLIFPGVARIIKELTDPSKNKYYVIDVNNTFEGQIPAKEFESKETLKKFLGNMVGASLWCDEISPRAIKEISNKYEHVILARGSYYDDSYHIRGYNDRGIEWNGKSLEQVLGSDNLEARKQIRQFYEVYGIRGIMTLCYVLGNYLTVRWNERLMCFVVGVSGDGKTALVLNSMRAIGTWTENDVINLAGDGATENAIREDAVNAGIGPQMIDDFKIVDEKAVVKATRIIHMLYSGSGKKRLNKDATMRDTENFHCGVVFTGECMINSQSVQSRIAMIPWQRRPEHDLYGKVPVDQIGGSWIDYLEQADVTKHTVVAQKASGINMFRLNNQQQLFMQVWRHFACCFGLEDLQTEMEDLLKKHIAEREDNMQASSEAMIFIQALRALYRTHSMDKVACQDKKNKDYWIDATGLFAVLKHGNSPQQVAMTTIASQCKELKLQVTLGTKRFGGKPTKVLIVPEDLVLSPEDSQEKVDGWIV